MSFKNFLIEECNNPDFIKWDVVLFLGDYSPITKKEYERIDQFVENVIKNPQWAARFTDRVDVGLISDVPHKENRLELEANYELTFDEKNYLTTKLFGLRMIRADFDTMNVLSKLPSKEEDFVELARDVVDHLKKDFHKANILVVLRPEDKDDVESFQKIRPYLQDEYINVGFLVFHEEQEPPTGYLRGVECNGETIKIIALLNADKPNPEDLRGFASKYKVHERIEDIRKIHFKTSGEKYFLAFEQFFPNLNLYDDKEQESIKANYDVVLDLLKEMYMKFAV